VEFETVRVPWRRFERAEVRALSGQDRVPLAVLDGEAICDSKRIVEHVRWRRSGAGARGAGGGTGIG
jgi:glutathione S-transferase